VTIRDRRTNRVGQSLREAVATMLAILMSFGAVWAIDPEPGPLILAVVLSLSLSRSQLDRDWRGRLEAAVVLPLVGLVSLGVGLLLRSAPIAGALVFIAGIAGSIWLRRFGTTARRAGSLIALPFVVLLVTPYRPPQQLGPTLTLLMPMVVALIALVSVTLMHTLGQRLQWLPASAPTNDSGAAVVHESALRPVASTRMAIQMAVALALAFAVSFGLFREHWSWVVLTAFIVNSGNRGRGDVAYKSLLRVVGAAIGTLIALVVTARFDGQDALTVGLMLLAVFLGVWLRPLGYAWWALFVTLALALLQGFLGSTAQMVLWPRLAEIIIGAIIGVAAAWFVLPVRSIAVLRLRIANALAVLSTAIDPATPVPTAEEFITAVARVEQVAPAFRARRWLLHRFDAMQPADWVDALTACVVPAAAIIRSGAVPKGLRSEVGKARRAMREPAQILPALQALRQCLGPPPGHEAAAAPR
jgi:hypothetical protein